MKLLFIAHASSYSETSSKPVLHLAPWVEALCLALAQEKEIELGLLFQCQFARSDNFALDNVQYFSLSTGLSSPLKKWWYKFSNAIHIPKAHQRYKQVLQVFKPDAICVFGTEFAFAEIVNCTQVPVVLHIQSLVNPYLKAWYSTGITNKIASSNTNKFNYLKGAGVLHAHQRFVKQAKRESEMLKQIKFVMGRTNWDRREVLQLAPQAKYFHVDEIMRAVFYASSFRVNSIAKHLITAINPNVYKGLDLIFETAAALELGADTPIEWTIAGIEASSEVIEMARAAAKAQPKRIQLKFLGPLSAQELLNHMLAADIYVHASAIENSSNSICEAMLVGMPVVALNTGGTSSLIEHGITGLLVETAQADAMADTIRDIIGNFNKRIQLSAAARERAKVRHSQEKIVTDLVQVFKACIKQNAN